MARARRTWSDMRAEIRRYLGDVDAPYTHGDDLLLDGWNMALDARALQLGLAKEAWTTRRYVDTIVSGERYYLVPEEAVRVARVVRVFEDGIEEPLVRDERAFDASRTSMAQSRYLPTFRFLGAHIVLDPPPSQEYVDGLAIECEIAEDRFSGDASKLPLHWPIYLEALLIMDTELFAFEQQQESGGELAADQQANAMSLLARRSRYAAQIEEYMARRTLSPSQVRRYSQGA
jgi:hypothetical protein